MCSSVKKLCPQLRKTKHNNERGMLFKGMPGVGAPTTEDIHLQFKARQWKIVEEHLRHACRSV